MPKDFGDGGFAGNTNQHGHAQSLKCAQVPQQGQVVLNRFAEAETGVDDNAILCHASGVQRSNALAQEFTHLGHHIAVARCFLHGLWVALHVHDTELDGGVRNGIQRARLAKPPNIVNHCRALSNRGTHHAGLVGVY